MDKQLAHFIGIIESGGLAAAADRLHVGQPALTASLKKLEERYGAQLVSRHNRGVRPTKSGELVYDHALLMQRLESGIQNKVRQAEGFENTPLNLACVVSKDDTGRSIGLPFALKTFKGSVVSGTSVVGIPSVLSIVTFWIGWIHVLDQAHL